jgi:glycosyltransferase involved in cell wall biosynthesis
MSRDLIKNKDIVIVGQQAWDVEIGSNCKNIALEFSKYNRVLYVNPPLDRFSRLKGRKDPLIIKRKGVIAGKIAGVSKQTDNLWELNPDKMIESVNWIKIRPLFKYLNWRNNLKFAKSIKKAIKDLGFNDVILFNDNDIFRSFYLKELLSPQLSIYYSRDYMLAVDYWKYHGKVLEPKLIAKSDVVVANSVYLTRYCKQYNSHSTYVGQGCDLELFTDSDDLEFPKELEGIHQPRIGYVGALSSSRLDIDALIYIAKTRPDWSLVLVGPADEKFKTSALNQLQNVHFVGSMPESRLSSFIKAFDVCLNPQLLNKLTIGNYPRKIDEYLAMGKPTVATLTEAMEYFKDFVYLATGKEEFVALIAKALAEDIPELNEARRSFASSHTWENSVAEIYHAVHIAQPLLKLE